MVNADKPWFVRGGVDYNTTNTGVFAFGREHGFLVNSRSFRQVYDYK